MRVLVCGGRDFEDLALVESTLDAIGVTEILEGGATGADAMARAWAESRGIPCRTFRADWNRYGRGAGPKRNQRMLEEGEPDLVVAFPGGRGTSNMMRLARVANIPVREVRATSVKVSPR